MQKPETQAHGIGGTGVKVTVTDQKTLLKDIADLLESRQGFSVATLNLDHVVKLRKSVTFAAAYRAHSHITADGNPIVWACRLARQQVELVPGSELVVPLTCLAADAGVPVALLGSSDNALSGAAGVLRHLCPGVKIVAQIAPPMGFDPTSPQAESYIKALAASKARLCFLALGAPKQECFAAFAAPQLPQIGFVSIGAGLDFLSGHQARAPRLTRILALEWAWRLGQNPSRMAGRYAKCLAVLPGLLCEALTFRWRGRPNN